MLSGFRDGKEGGADAFVRSCDAFSTALSSTVLPQTTVICEQVALHVRNSLKGSAAQDDERPLVLSVLFISISCLLRTTVGCLSFALPEKKTFKAKKCEGIFSESRTAIDGLIRSGLNFCESLRKTLSATSLTVQSDNDVALQHLMSLKDAESARRWGISGGHMDTFAAAVEKVRGAFRHSPSYLAHISPLIEDLLSSLKSQLS
jgi:hypothetical protein